MRLLIIGALEGQLSEATKMAMNGSEEETKVFVAKRKLPDGDMEEDGGDEEGNFEALVGDEPPVDGEEERPNSEDERFIGLFVAVSFEYSSRTRSCAIVSARANRTSAPP